MKKCQRRRTTIAYAMLDSTTRVCEASFLIWRLIRVDFLSNDSANFLWKWRLCFFSSSPPRARRINRLSCVCRVGMARAHANSFRYNSSPYYTILYSTVPCMRTHARGAAATHSLSLATTMGPNDFTDNAGRRNQFSPPPPPFYSVGSLVARVRDGDDAMRERKRAI